MKTILEIPDNLDQVNRWIEDLIVSPDFVTLVGQLQVVNSLADDQMALTISDSKLNEIAISGMDGCTLEECQALLRSPEKLFQLHGQIFEAGSDYWIDKIKNDPTESQFLNQFSSELFEERDSEPRSKNSLRSQNESAQLDRANPSGVSRRLISLAAVVGFLGLSLYYIVSLVQTDASSWGWQSKMAVTETTTPSEYLQTLSRSGLEWFDQRRGTPAQLAARLEEFSLGCQRLIESPHAPLSDADRKWLIEKCQTWKGKIDQLASAAKALDPSSSADADFENLKDAADDLASKISLAISRRAESI